MKIYLKNLLIFGDEKGGVIWEIELNPPQCYWSQEVVVDKVIATECDQDEGFVHELLRLFCSNKDTQSLLVLLKIPQLLPNPYYIYLPQTKIK